MASSSDSISVQMPKKNLHSWRFDLKYTLFSVNLDSNALFEQIFLEP